MKKEETSHFPSKTSQALGLADQSNQSTTIAMTKEEKHLFNVFRLLTSLT